MGSKIPVVEGVMIRFKGHWDATALYMLVKSYLGGKKFDVEEPKYKDKGDELELDFLATRVVTDYIKYQINVSFDSKETKEVEVKKDGKTVQMTRGRITIEMSSTMITDWNDIFKDGKFNKFLGRVFWKIKEREMIFVHADKLEFLTWELHSKIKKLLDVQTQDTNY